MRKFLAVILLILSFQVQAVDVVITLTGPQALRFAYACGLVKKLVDTQQPPQPRPCTMAEAKQFIIERMRQLVIDVEGSIAAKAAIDAIVIPAFDPS